MNHQRRLRAACREFLRALDVQPPLEMGDLCQRVGKLRGRPIHLIEHELTDALALSFSLADAEVIAWRPHTSNWHRDHSIAHELAHIFCKHLDPQGGYGDYTPAEIRDITGLLARIPNVEPPPETVRRRACYDTPHEAAVEFIATTFLEWAVLPGYGPVVTPQDFQRGRRLQRTLSFRRGWL